MVLGFFFLNLPWLDNTISFCFSWIAKCDGRVKGPLKWPVSTVLVQQVYINISDLGSHVLKLEAR